MKTANWRDFEILDAGDGEKLERWGGYILARPDPQAIWPKRDKKAWENAHASYQRSPDGGGAWEFHKQLPERWEIGYGKLRFIVKPTGFKHMGLFPEQAVNWEYLMSAVKKSGGRARVLNLFAYTGGATAACALAGAEVVHVDAAKGMVAWAKDNLAKSGLQNAPVRYLVDDVLKFVQREKRRGNAYEGIIMDPPSFGRGPGGQVWHLEEGLYPLVEECAGLLSSSPVFFLLNSYTAGLAPGVLETILSMAVRSRLGGYVDSYELGLPIRSMEGAKLPCGASGLWEAKAL
ncbi:MAG: class I SAM-dependent methyltransferase [Bacillota bacterium]|nr:class I SAM-dependent methyltransferase [Bacillota bacterium]